MVPDLYQRWHPKNHISKVDGNAYQFVGTAGMPPPASPLGPLPWCTDRDKTKATVTKPFYPPQLRQKLNKMIEETLSKLVQLPMLTVYLGIRARGALRNGSNSFRVKVEGAKEEKWLGQCGCFLSLALEWARKVAL